MPKVSVTLITRDEAARIGDALASVQWADEIVVVDSGSADDTVAIARRLGARVEHRDWDGYAAQKNYAASLARHDWILSLDADERVSLALAGQIRQVLAAEPGARGYRMPRVSQYLGRWMRCTDWYPDEQLRLYDRRAGDWVSTRVHESVTVRGPVSRLAGEIEHYPYADLSDHLRRIDHYTTLAALDLRDRGRRASMGALVAYPAAAFARNFVLKRGYRAGRIGLTVSLLNSYYVFLKMAKLLELERAPRDS